MKAPAYVLAIVLAMATVAHADTVPPPDPTSIEVLSELAIIGNDITVQATPQTIDDAIEELLDPYDNHSYITTDPLYQINFYSDGTAFLFRLPADGGGNSTIGGSTAVPEPNTVILLLTGVVLTLVWYRFKLKERK